MSRSSNDVLAIGLGTCAAAVGVRPTRLQSLLRLAQRARRGVKAVTAPPSLPPAIEHASIAMEEAQYFSEQGALDVLRRALAEAPGVPGPATRSKRRALIVLDDFWANHGILRGDFRTVRAREVEDIARSYFAETFGLDGDAIMIRTVMQRGGRAVFASALSRSLHDGIRDVSAAARVEVQSLMLGLPQAMNRARHSVDGGASMLVVVAETVLHAVLIDHKRWVAYGAHRLFADDVADPLRLAAIAEQVFERFSNARREDCTIYLGGIDLDPSAFEQRFATVRRLQEIVSSASAPLRLMGFAL
ncbi:hypothetical protein [Cupriavidus basilensis]|uniref:hypothetical protein n=1 Tax=Cupriavidus basilensis TaxID=68895 RepID=UPI00157B51A2|nr:hypothetical protein [Cupriavidus basilensis]NUA27833.1 hypothetical protein [Cupriavidus basilensis]